MMTFLIYVFLRRATPCRFMYTMSLEIKGTRPHLPTLPLARGIWGSIAPGKARNGENTSWTSVLLPRVQRDLSADWHMEDTRCLQHTTGRKRKGGLLSGAPMASYPDEIARSLPHLFNLVTGCTDGPEELPLRNSARITDSARPLVQMVATMTQLRSFHQSSIVADPHGSALQQCQTLTMPAALHSVVKVLYRRSACRQRC